METVLKPLKLSQKKGQDTAIIIAGIAATVTTASFIYFAYQKYNKVNDSARLKKIPSPRGSLPLLGHILSVGKDANRQFKKWHDEVGPIFQIKMGRQTWIMISDPCLAQKVFVTHGAQTSFRPYNTYGYMYYSFKGYGIGFSQPGEHWNKNRAAASAVLAPKHIDTFEEVIANETLYLANCLLNATLENGSVDPMKNFELLGTNIIYTACFGKRFSSISDPGFYDLAEMGKTHMVLAGFQNELPNFVPLLSFVNVLMGADAKMKHHINEERDPTYRKLIKDAQNAEGPNLLKTIKEDFDMSDDELVVFAADFMIAASDTISVTLAWDFALLCYYPDVQKKIFEEIDGFISKTKRLPNFQERNEVPYTVAVMRECMRFRPATPIAVPHCVAKDVVVDEYLFPKGCTVVASVGTMHMNPCYYSDPEVFKPERYLNNTKTMIAAANGKLENRDHFTFGWGRRICPGIYLAEMELFHAFTQILARAEILPDKILPDIDSIKASGITFVPNSYRLKCVAREGALV